MIAQLMALLRTSRVRNSALLVALAPVLLAGCVQGGTDHPFWDLILGMIALFFWFMLIWIFIAIFADILRRRDLSGGGKVVWIIVLVLIPFLGAIIYLVARPRTAGYDAAGYDSEAVLTMAPASAPASQSVADQIAGLNQLRVSGAITEADYQSAKQKIIG